MLACNIAQKKWLGKHITKRDCIRGANLNSNLITIRGMLEHAMMLWDQVCKMQQIPRIHLKVT